MSTPLPTTLRILRSLTDIPRATWDALVDAQATPFLEWTFLTALEESGCAVPARGWHPRHLTLWRGSRLVAAAPAYLKDDSDGEFVFDSPWATAAERAGLRYYPKLVLAVPFTPATGRRVLVAPGEDRAAREAELYAAAQEFARAERLSGIHVLFSTEEELPVLVAQGFAVRLGVQYHWRNQGYRTLEDFLARFHAKRRNQLRRELRALTEHGIEVRTLRGDALADADADTVYRLYATTVDKYPWGQRFLTPDFFARMLARFRHRCEWVEARREGRLVAGAFNFTGANVLYGRYWGCFEEHPFLHFNVCLYHPISEGITSGLERFEPGAGGEHKLTRGFEPRLTYSAHLLLHPGMDKAVRGFLAHERAAVEGSLPQWRAETGFKEGD
ncbi:MULTISPECIES: GNAT family N-acetyltransferase [Myxococcus]|uniref:GNAT family N-acetyltransferase n=1 Tax=Myxococcus TaxID=32 RepID=UPI00148D74EC|nr:MULTISPECIES: GNAT family N-acetyltransferase [Myxococcus]